MQANEINYDSIIADLTNPEIQDHITHFQEQLYTLSNNKKIFLDVPRDIVVQMLTCMKEGKDFMMGRLIEHVTLDTKMYDAIMSCFSGESARCQNIVKGLLACAGNIPLEE